QDGVRAGGRVRGRRVRERRTQTRQPDGPRDGLRRPRSADLRRPPADQERRGHERGRRHVHGQFRPDPDGPGERDGGVAERQDQLRTGRRDRRRHERSQHAGRRVEQQLPGSLALPEGIAAEGRWLPSGGRRLRDQEGLRRERDAARSGDAGDAGGRKDETGLVGFQASMRGAKMRRIVLSGVLALSAAVVLAETVPELFSKVKEQVKAEKWNDAMVTMEVIDTEAAKPANAQYQAQLEGPLAFYRGVCDANLGNAAKAQADFEAFLRTKPDAGIDDKVYSKKAVAAFAAAQKAIASAGPSIARAYAEFRPPARETEVASATWGDGPVVWLMTPSEKSAWAAAATDDDRAAFVDKFWKARVLEDDPSFRAAFDKRVAFADANFSQDEKRGSMTDRGMVFVLLGPPTYGGRKPLKSGDDANDPNGMSSRDTMAETIAMHQAQASRTSSATVAAMVDRNNAPSTVAPESNMNYQEVWHYRRELLPKGVSYIQVDAVFLTRKGYGKNVLQRESDILTTLDAAKQKPQ